MLAKAENKSRKLVTLFTKQDGPSEDLNAKEKQTDLVRFIRERMVSHVRTDHEPGEVFVPDRVNGVTDDAQDVETRQDRLG